MNKTIKKWLAIHHPEVLAQWEDFNKLQIKEYRKKWQAEHYLSAQELNKKTSE